MKILSISSVLFVITVIAAGIFFAGCQKTSQSTGTDSTISSSTIMDDDQLPDQNVSNASDFETIETELDNTVILEEDFSDL